MGWHVMHITCTHVCTQISCTQITGCTIYITSVSDSDDSASASKHPYCIKFPSSAVLWISTAIISLWHQWHYDNLAPITFYGIYCSL